MESSPQARIAERIAESAAAEVTALTATLTDLAIELRDDAGLDQRSMFVEFNRVRDGWDDKDYRVRDALETVLDRVSGWCEPRYNLFP